MYSLTPTSASFLSKDGLTRQCLSLSQGFFRLQLFARDGWKFLTQKHRGKLIFFRSERSFKLPDFECNTGRERIQHLNFYRMKSSLKMKTYISLL